MENIKTALITGASGLIGTELVRQLLADERFGKVIVWVRTELSIIHPNLQQSIIDFDNIGSLSAMQGVDCAFCALGTTIHNAGSQAAQYKIDYEYVVRFGEYCRRSNIHSLAVVSSLGANAQSSNFYLRTKGEMEEALKRLQLPSLVMVRPSLLMGNRREFRLGEEVMIPLMKLFAPLFIGSWRKYRGVEASKVAACLVSESLANTDPVKIIENDQI